MSGPDNIKTKTSSYYFLIIAGIFGLYTSISNYKTESIISLIKVGIPSFIIIFSLTMIIRSNFNKH